MYIANKCILDIFIEQTIYNIYDLYTDYNYEIVLDKSEGPMSFVVIVPGWTDDAAFQELRQS